MITRRSDPRRVALLSALVLGAVLYAVGSGDDGWLDAIRFLAGAVAGGLIGLGMRRLDDGLNARVSPGEAERLAGLARRLAPVVGVAAGLVIVVAGGLSGEASVWLADAFAGTLVAVGLLYPLPCARE